MKTSVRRTIYFLVSLFIGLYFLIHTCVFYFSDVFPYLSEIDEVYNIVLVVLSAVFSLLALLSFVFFIIPLIAPLADEKRASLSRSIPRISIVTILVPEVISIVVQSINYGEFYSEMLTNTSMIIIYVGIVVVLGAAVLKNRAGFIMAYVGMMILYFGLPFQELIFGQGSVMSTANGAITTILKVLVYASTICLVVLATNPKNYAHNTKETMPKGAKMFAKLLKVQTETATADDNVQAETEDTKQKYWEENGMRFRNWE